MSLNYNNRGNNNGGGGGGGSGGLGMGGGGNNNMGGGGGGGGGGNLGNTMKLFASLGLSPSDLDALAEIPEQEISVETLPAILMRLKSSRKNKQDVMSSGGGGGASDGPSAYQRGGRGDGSWDGMGRMMGSSRQQQQPSSSSSSSVVDFDADFGPSSSSSSGRRGYGLDYTGGGGGGGGGNNNQRGGDNRHSSSSSYSGGGGGSYGNIMGPPPTQSLSNDGGFGMQRTNQGGFGMGRTNDSGGYGMQRRAGAPSNGKIQDFVGVSPRLFPHVCSLCDFDVHSTMDWNQHTNGLRHAEKRRQLLDMYPDWDPSMSSGLSGSIMDTPNLSPGLLGPAPMTGMGSSWGGSGKSGMNQSGPAKFRSRVVVVKYDRKPLSNKTLFAFTEPFGFLREHLVLNNKAFFELSTHEEAMDMVNYYERQPASLYGKPIHFYLSKRLLVIEKDDRPSNRVMDRPQREVKGQQASQVVFFSNLPREEEKKRELLTIAERFGTVEKKLFLSDQAFVQLGTPEDAEMLVKYYSVNPLTIHGRSIRLNICTKYKTLRVNKRLGTSSSGDSRGRDSSDKSSSSSRSKDKEREKEKDNKEREKEKDNKERESSSSSKSSSRNRDREDKKTSDSQKSEEKKKSEEKSKKSAEKAPEHAPENWEDSVEGETALEGETAAEGETGLENEELDDGGSAENDGENEEEKPTEKTEGETEEEGSQQEDEKEAADAVDDDVTDDVTEEAGGGAKGSDITQEAESEPVAESTRNEEKNNNTNKEEEEEAADSSDMMMEGDNPDDEKFDESFLENMEDFVTLDELAEEEEESHSDTIDNSRRGGMRVVVLVGFRRGYNYLNELLALAKPFGKIAKHLVLDLRPHAYIQFYTEAEARAMASFYSSGNVTASVCGRPVRVTHSMTYPTIQSGSSRVVYIGQIPNTKYSDDSLVKLAEPYGRVRRYFINRIKKECFLEMASEEEAEKMAAHCKNHPLKFNGKRLTSYVSRKYRQLKHGHMIKRSPPKHSDEPASKKTREEEEGEDKQEVKHKDKMEDAKIKAPEEEEEEEEEEERKASSEEKKEETPSETVPETTEQQDKQSGETQTSEEQQCESMEASSTNQSAECEPEVPPPVEVKPIPASLPLPEFQEGNPIGVEHVKMGYYCRVCFLFYSNEEMAKKSHCGSKLHYDKLQKHLEKEAAKAEKKKGKKTTTA